MIEAEYFSFNMRLDNFLSNAVLKAYLAYLYFLSWIHFCHSGQWGKIVHERRVLWLACHKNSLNGEMKYIFISSQSSFIRNKENLTKFEKVRKVKEVIDGLRDIYTTDLASQVHFLFHFLFLEGLTCHFCQFLMQLREA